MHNRVITRGLTIAGVAIGSALLIGALAVAMIGRPEAGWDEVLAASEAAGVAAFVDDLPDGYDTMRSCRGRCR